MTKANQAPGSLIKPEAVRQLFEPSGWRFLFRYLRPHQLRLALFCVVALLNAALALPILYFIKYGFDRAIPDRAVNVLIAIGIAILLCRALNSAIIVLQRRSIVRLIKAIMREMRMDLIAKLYRLPRDTQGDQDIARYHNRIVQDSERVDTLCNVLFSSVLPALFTAAALTGCLLYLQWKLVIIVFTVAPLIWLANRLTTPAVQRGVQQFQSAFEQFSRGVLFVLRNRELTQQKAFEAEELARQGSHIARLSKTGLRMSMNFALHGQLQRNVTGMAAVLLLVVGGISVIQGSLTLGDFMAFFAAAAMLNASIDTVLDGVPGLITGNESLRLLGDIAGAAEADAYRGSDAVAFAGGVSLEQVSFAYGGKSVLEDVSLRLDPHSVTAIVGPNGAGKSTIIHLIMGFLRPATGKLLADSHPYDDLDMRSLRRRIGLVPQHPVFFKGTLRENICYGHPDIAEMNLTRALIFAQAASFIAELPLGLESPMGEDGIMLSGGQKQRLALARALIGEPGLLILDEPANHLDLAGIRSLIATLAALPNRPTILMISHNADVTSIAGCILELRAGRLSPWQSDPAASVESSIG
ncbi:MAG: ABC transporter ATP-binding protein [Rhizomicrobium sp.]